MKMLLFTVITLSSLALQAETFSECFKKDDNEILQHPVKKDETENAHQSFRVCFAKNDESTRYNAILMKQELSNLEALIKEDQLPVSTIVQESEQIFSHINKLFKDSACSIECQDEFESIHNDLLICYLLKRNPVLEEMVDKISTSSERISRDISRDREEQTLRYIRTKLLNRVHTYKNLLPSIEK
jgi:hypothetical protein